MNFENQAQHAFSAIAQGIRVQLKDVCSSAQQMFAFLSMLRGSFQNTVGTPFFFQYGTMDKNNISWMWK